MARPEKVRLGEILVQQKLLTPEQLKLALDEQKRSGRKLGRVFIEQGYVTEEEISEALAKQLQIPYINLKYYNIKPEVVQKLPETQARRFRAIVLEDNPKALKIGMADPTDLNAYDEIARIVKHDIEIAVVTETQLLGVIDRVYRRTSEITGLAQELQAELGDDAVDFGALSITPGLEEAPVVKLLQSVFEDATQVRASDIHIEPQEKKLVIRFRIDGLLHLQTEADPKIASALVLRLKLMSGLDISEKRLPQDGRFNVKIRTSMVDVRLSTMPTQYGESVVMRLLNQGSGILTLDRIGMPPHILERVQAVLQRPSGMMLVTGPTGIARSPAPSPAPSAVAPVVDTKAPQPPLAMAAVIATEVPAAPAASAAKVVPPAGDAKVASASAVSAVSVIAPLPPVAPKPRAADIGGEPRVQLAATGAQIDKRMQTLTTAQMAENEYREAANFLGQGRLVEAQDSFRQALQNNPLHAGARQGLFGLLVDAKRTPEAEQLLKEGLKLNANQPGLALALARLQLDRADANAAIETLQASAASAQNSPDYLAFFAGLLQRQSRHREAVEQYLAALRLAPNSGVWLMGLGISLQALGRNTDAQDAFRRARASNTLNAELQAFVDQRLRQLQ